MSAYEKLEQLRVDKYYAKHQQAPHKYFSSELKVKKPKTAAQLESLICELIELSGGVCTKVYSGGRPIVTEEQGRDITGKKFKTTDVKWIPGTTEPGTSDLIASLPKYIGAVYIEVKFSKGDRQRSTQVKFQNKVEQSGFLYIIVTCLDDIIDIGLI